MKNVTNTTLLLVFDMSVVSPMPTKTIAIISGAKIDIQLARRIVVSGSITAAVQTANKPNPPSINFLFFGILVILAISL